MPARTLTTDRAAVNIDIDHDGRKRDSHTLFDQRVLQRLSVLFRSRRVLRPHHPFVRVALLMRTYEHEIKLVRATYCYLSGKGPRSSRSIATGVHAECSTGGNRTV